MNALILAAGLGTRLGEFTADRPKALVEVQGRTMLEHQLRHLSEAGCNRFITLLTARRNTSRYLYFNNNGALCGWSNEKTGEVRSPLSDFDKTKYAPYAFQGIHVISKSILPLLDAIPEKRFGITDFYVSNAGCLNLQMVESDPSQWVDAGKPETLVKAAQIVKSIYEHTA